MKNQLALITDEPTRNGGQNPTSTPRSGRPTGPRATNPSLGVPRNVERAHKGADAARRALQDAVRRATAREDARREAREAALLAAVTQPHLPHLGGTPDHRAA